jgi:hypothetical protein
LPEPKSSLAEIRRSSEHGRTLLELIFDAQRPTPAARRKAMLLGLAAAQGGGAGVARPLLSDIRGLGRARAGFVDLHGAPAVVSR